MQFGVFFATDKDFQPVLDGLRLAEDVGFEFAGLIDSPYNFMDVYPYLAAGALATKKIHLGPYVTNPLTRHPSVTASAMATINVMSEGRAFLGLGRGDSGVKMLGWKPAKWKDYTKAIEDMRTWMRGEPVTVDGAPAPLSLPWASGLPEIPIDLGLFGPRGAKVAGQIGDIATTECTDLGTVKWFYDMTQEAAREAGRGSVQFECSIATHVSDDVAKAREMCRWEPEILTNLIWGLMRSTPIEELPPSLVKGFEWLAEEDDWWGKHDWSLHAKVSDKHQQMISDEQVDRFCVCGSVQTCVDKLKELEKIGVSRFCAYLVDMPQDELHEQIRIIGEKIIPEFN